MKLNTKGIIFVISAPSGTGKTTICERLLKSLPDLKMSISHTTRKPRTGERDGVDYYFIDKTKFKEMISNNDFIEWAEVYGNFYGTSKKVINELLNSGNDILLDIDTQGAKNIKKIYPESVLIFMLPPSIEELKRRLSKRKEKSNIIKSRLDRVVDEIIQYEFYDYLLINDNLEKALNEIMCIIFAERLKINRINKKFINNFLKKI
ncbi:MAG: guanylate kinase [Thermodesulfovibrio sp.]|nr:guanylate kinase [Thermodesulfovibrio sp.]